MAVTKILAKSILLDRLVNYIKNGDKTNEETLVTTINCTPEEAAKQMLQTKMDYDKTDGVQAYHIIQSFMIGEISPETAHQLGEEFSVGFLPGYEVVIGTHVDKDHIHNHICFNSVNMKTGIKYHSSPESYYKGIRKFSDELCRRHGLSVIMETGGKGFSYIEWKLHKAGLLTYREMVDLAVEECLSLALDIGNFYELMEDRGFVIEHHSRYPSFIPDGAKAPFRAKRNGKSLTEDDLRMMIEEGLDISAPEVIVSRHKPQYQNPGKLHGFRALYTHWMYVLGIIGQGGRVPYTKVSYKELRRFKQYKKQQAFLDANDIDTMSQLNDKRESIAHRIETLTKTRTILNSKKHRNKSLYEALAAVEYLSEVPELYFGNPSGFEKEYARFRQAEQLLEGKDRDALQQERSELYKQLSDVNAEIRRLRNEQQLCEVIAHDAPEINRKLDRLMDEREITNKEETDAEKHERPSQRDHGRS